MANGFVDRLLRRRNPDDEDQPEDFGQGLVMPRTPPSVTPIVNQQPTQPPVPAQTPSAPAQNQSVPTQPRRQQERYGEQPSFQGRLLNPPAMWSTQRDPQALAQASDEEIRQAESGRPRIADQIGFDANKLRDFQNKPLNWRDKAGMVAQVISRSLGGQPLPTRRERRIDGAEQQLGQDLALQKARTSIAQGQMVPFQLPDGSWTYIPARSAATTASRQQGQQANLSLRRQQMDYHKDRWDHMAKHEAAQDAQRLFNSGAADDNDDLKDEIASRMGLPPGTRLPNHDKGQVVVDGAGNVQVVDTRAATARQVTQPGSTKPMTSMQGTLEQGRNRRAAASEAGKNERAGMRGGAQRRISAGEREKIAAGYGDYDSFHKQLTSIDEDIKKANALPANWKEVTPATSSLPESTTTKNDKLAQLGRKRQGIVDAASKRMAELNQLDPENEWGSGEGGYPYRKPREQQQAAPTPAPARRSGGRRGGRMSEAEAIERFKNDPRNTEHRAPTEEELNVFRSHPNNR